MKRTVKAEQIAQIRALAAARLGQRDIAKRVGCSLGFVNKVLATPEATAAPKAGRASKSKLEALPVSITPIDLSPEASLARAAEQLEHACAEARHDKDNARLIAASRAAAQVAVAASKLPKPDPTSDERADTIAAAKRAREKLHDLFDRLLAEPQS